MALATLTETLHNSTVIAVLRAPRAEDYQPVIETLIDTGVTAIELTLTTPGTLEVIDALQSRFADRAALGVGTVLTTDDAQVAIDAGARFIIAPNFNKQIVELSLAHEVPAIPGALTPTEVAAALVAGVPAVKIFPAQTVGAAYLKHLHGPFPGLQAIPSGGVDLEEAQAWLAAGSPAVSVGGPLLGDVFQTHDLDALRDRAHKFVEDLERA